MKCWRDTLKDKISQTLKYTLISMIVQVHSVNIALKQKDANAQI